MHKHVILNLIDDRSIIYSMINSTTTKRGRGRPPKSQQGLNETREALLQAGVAILTERGYSSTGIEQILRSVGVPKGSFYHYFSSKEVFVAELITRYANFFKRKLDKSLLNQQLNPLDRLEAFMCDATDGMAKYNYKRGCLVGNLGQEMGALPEPFREQLKNTLSEWQEKVEACLVEAKKAGQISHTIDCREASYVFWTGWEGAVLRAKLEGNSNALTAFSRFFLNSLR